MKKYARHIFTVLVLLLAGLQVSGQHYIGLHSDRIATELKRQNPDFRLDNSAVNNTYHYLKFVDDVSEQTMLFFLSDKDVCMYVRWMSDYANLTEITNLLNTEYKKAGEKRWTYSEGDKRFSVTLEEGEWYFTVNMNPE